MIKSELILRIAKQNPHLYARDVERVVSAILSRVTDGLVAGDRVELRGFGAFTVKTRVARYGRNPKTGDRVTVDLKTKVAFKASRVMADRLNRSEGQEASEVEAGTERLPGPLSKR